MRLVQQGMRMRPAAPRRPNKLILRRIPVSLRAFEPSPQIHQSGWSQSSGPDRVCHTLLYTLYFILYTLYFGYSLARPGLSHRVSSTRDATRQELGHGYFILYTLYFILWMRHAKSWGTAAPDAGHWWRERRRFTLRGRGRRPCRAARSWRRRTRRSAARGTRSRLARLRRRRQRRPRRGSAC